MSFNHGFERKMFNREQRHFMEKRWYLTCTRTFSTRTDD